MRRSTAVLAGIGSVAVAYALYHRTDAYRHGNRLFYREGRPNAAGRAAGAAWARVSGWGLTPSWAIALETVGHKTGRRHAIPLVVADFDGRRYLVSMLGERSPWVRNVRAAGGQALIRHGTRRAVRLVEVPAEERAPIIKAYLARALGGRPHIPVDPAAPVEAFDAIAAGYPVFRIDPADQPALVSHPDQPTLISQP
jgi:hypothetical protein